MRRRALDEGVELVEDRLRGRLAVRKVARPGQEGALEREHAQLVGLRHPGLRELWAARRAPRPTLILEHVDGAAPAEWVAVDQERARALAVGLLRVLSHLHERGLVHGDLKPDNVLVEAGTPRLIDLGLAVPVGGRVAGGTRGFVAPEYRRGAPASVAGDLFALGRTLGAVISASGDAELDALLAACVEEDPARRPASAAAALAQLGERALPEDRHGRLPLPRAHEAVVEELDAALRRGDGSAAVLRGPRGAGHGRVFDELRRRSAAAWRDLLDGSLTRGALARWVDQADPDGGGELSARAMRAASRASSAIVLGDAWAAGPDERRALASVVRALGAIGRHAVVVVGADEGLAARLEAEGASVRELPALDAPEVRATLEASGARSTPALARRLATASGGRAGRVARAARELARRPELTDAEVLELAAPPRKREGAPPSREEALERAAEAVRLGAGRRAERLLREAFGELGTEPEPPAGHDPARSRALDLWADALELAGRLADAERVLARRGRPEDDGRRARLLERLGRYEEAVERARGRPEAAVTEATAALALGRVDDARDAVERALDALDGEARSRLLLVGSDVALREGRYDAAIEAARAALDASGESTRLAAEAHSRIASALALRGDPGRARRHHAEALKAAQNWGDVAMLPPYVVNLATADHALGQLGAAIARYEEGARLAERLGRASMRAVALTNLAGLLVSVGALDEAAGVLRGALEAAERSGSALYTAQATLIDAERCADRDRARALELARRARARFEACGATRQALEARLLEAELRADAEAEAFCVAEADALDEAGLGARAWILRAERALEEARLEEARGAVDRAVGAAERLGDRGLEGRARAAAARVYHRLGSPEADRHQQRARACFDEVAQSLPPGLRERYRQGVEPEAPRGRSSRSAASAPGLGDGGRRLLGLLRRVLLEPDERRVLEAAVDEAVASTRAERAFLLRRRSRADEEVLVARNLDRDTIRSGRFSRSVAERVMETGEPVLTEYATDDPTLETARSVVDLGLRSILCVPVRSPSSVVGALYLDHRFETARFDADDLELVGALGDLIGLALQNARLHREAREHARRLERANEAMRHENVLATARLERLEQRLAALPEEDADDSGIVGRSEPLRRALGVARRVAPSDLSVLIEGESGTGKELFARHVHARSLRSDGPFLAINCGALPEGLLESELFGHVRGAFTGATRDHPGLFRSAEGGSLLLDEIGEMPPRMQTRLLRVLQEREVVPVGRGEAVPIDVRVLAATNRDLEREVEDGRFREDLYFRLVGVRIELPPLRERPEDLGALVSHALARIAREPGMKQVTVSPRALDVLARQRWPGNVRELEQTLRRAVLVAEGEILEPEDLALDVAAPLDRKRALERFDRKLVERALRANDGNRTRTAEALGVSRMTIHRWIKRYGLT